MKLQIFSIYDSKAQAYLRPFFAPTKGLAMRSLLDALAQPDHDFSRYSQDYTLFSLGEWDDSNAKINMHATPESIGVLSEFVTDTQRVRDRLEAEGNLPQIPTIKTPEAPNATEKTV